MADHHPLDLQIEALETMFAERLRDLPSETFRQKLKEKLMQVATNQPTYMPEGFHTITPYLISSGAGRLIEFMTTIWNGVVVVPCSLKPRTWKRSTSGCPCTIS